MQVTDEGDGDGDFSALLESGSKIDTQGVAGLTALHHALLYVSHITVRIV